MLRLQANTVHALLKKNISLETPLGVELRQTPIIQIEFIIFSQILKCIKKGRNFQIFQFINLKHFEEIERLLLKHVQILQKQFSEQSVSRSQQSSNKETLYDKKKTIKDTQQKLQKNNCNTDFFIGYGRILPKQYILENSVIMLQINPKLN